MSQGNHPDHPPIPGGYTGLTSAGEWRRRGPGSYIQNYTANRISIGMENRVPGIHVYDLTGEYFIPMTILRELLADSGYAGL